MYEAELQRYCERHNLEVVETYTTMGDERGRHQRAIVRHKGTGERYRLYYDESRKRRTLAQQQRDLDIYKAGGIPPLPKARGWRNATLDNKGKLKRRNKRDK